jgi:hypothetical protein
MLEEHAAAEAALQSEITAARHQLAAAKAANEKAAHEMVCESVAAKAAHEMLQAEVSAAAAREARLRRQLEQAAVDAAEAKERGAEALEQQRKGVLALQHAASRERGLWATREKVLREESCAAAAAMQGDRARLRAAETDAASSKRRAEAAAAETREAWAAAEAAAEADRMGCQALATANKQAEQDAARARDTQIKLSAAVADADARAAQLAHELSVCQQQRCWEAAEAEEGLRLVHEELARERHALVSAVGAAEIQTQDAQKAKDAVARCHTKELYDQRQSFAATLAHLEAQLGGAKAGLVKERLCLVESTLRRVCAEQAARESVLRSNETIRAQLDAERLRAAAASSCLVAERNAAEAALKAEQELVDEIFELRARLRQAQPLSGHVL